MYIGIAVLLAGCSVMGSASAAPESSAASAQQPYSAKTSVLEAPLHETVLWQGFMHEWNGHGLATGFTAHRISKFSSLITDIEAPQDAGRIRARAIVGQERYGDFGEWMEPELRATAFRDSRIAVQPVMVEVKATDRLSGDPQQASLAVRERLVIDLSRVEANVGSLDGYIGDVLLNGMYLDTFCEEDHQPPATCDPQAGGCGELCEQPPEQSGVWPARWQVEVQDCTLLEDADGPRMECDFQAVLTRALPPDEDRNPGFRPPIRYPAVMDYVARWHFVAIVGPAEEVRFTRVEVAAEKRLKKKVPERTLDIQGVPSSQLPNAILGLHQFGFDLERPAGAVDTDSLDYDNLGRMIARLDFGVHRSLYDAERGVAAVTLSQGVFTKWRTEDSDVRTRLGLTLVQLGSASAVAPTRTAEGSVCQSGGPNTKAGFRNWQGCSRGTKGPEQTEDTIELEFFPGLLGH